VARYEFVEGKSSKFWEIHLDGTTLDVRFGRIGTSGQSQTKTFATPDLARKEHDKLVAEKTKKGYALAAGDHAAPAPPASPPRGKTKAPSTASLRKDLYVYNEATGFAITSRRLGGRGIDGGSDPWHTAVRNGDLIPIELTQDDPFFIRVVVGGELEPQESEEWVGRLDWKLRVPDGNLVVVGGAEYLMEEFDGEESDYVSEYVRHVRIPRGEYRATVYMYFGGVNGHSCLTVARDGDEPDPLGEWFRRTRPNEKFPAWLHNDCVVDPDEDPGHEAEWKKAKKVNDPNENYVDFLLHLTPLASGEKVPMPVVAEDGGENGWFCQPFVCRVPERIPLGLPARDPEGLKKEREDDKTEEKPLLVYEQTSRFAIAPLDRSVEVPLAQLVRLYRLAWFCHAWAMPHVRIAPPAGGGATLPAIDATAEGVQVKSDAHAITIEFTPTGRQGGALRGLVAVAPALEGIPDGSTLHLEVANLDPDEMKKPRPMGLHRYEGTIKNDVLSITKAFPVSDAATLEAALALSAQVDTTDFIDAGSEEIFAAVMKSLKAHPYFEDNRAVKRTATGIATKKPEPILLAVIASEVFHKTFKQQFPLFDYDVDDEEDDDDDILEVPVAPRDSEPPMPPIGVELMRGNRRRVFHSTDAAAMGPDAQKRIADVEKDLVTIGFKHVADVVCKQMQAVMVRAYAQEDGTVWAAMLISSYARGTFEFISYFETGASLTTTTHPMARDELYRNTYKTRRGEGKVLEMWAEHQERAAYLAGFHGGARKVDQTPVGLATAVELSIQRQEESKPSADKTLLLKTDDRSYYGGEAIAIHPAMPALVADADGKMKALGFVHVGDVVGTFFTNHAVRGYTQPDGDVWALYMIDASTLEKPDGAWDFVTAFEKGAVLSSTRGALSKDEPKRKIFRIIDPQAPPDVLLNKHQARKTELSKKWGKPMPVSADMKGLAVEAANVLKRTIG
jgi:predicted DNA-binding WGR domain protein